ncbi:MAG: hybrid sensor histidine kinase/response regulator [Gemmatimonadetes bacterium]|jgi:two-component system cell cycle sensor histidine kinase/response regulator CckA|nr:MAG: hybrid sensor histidine kinase/response regulator [Gemmatimonadota bacterium]
MDTQALEARLREANKLEALARFARGVAHDFNNIFTAVTANCDLLLEDITPDDPRRPEVVAIRDAVERATDLTRRLFKLGAVQALESELVDLNDLVRATEQELTALAGDRIGVATSLEPRFSPLTADPRELKQILLNLVLNARDAMPDGGQITIETANVVLDETYAADHRLMPQGHYALLAITDTGTGMDAEARAHLFEPYFTTRDRSARSGLGLATVYGVVKRSGGFVWVYSEPGLGTSVKIYLPLPRPGPTPVLPTPVPIVSLRGTETILLVEDEESVRAVARHVLQRHGYAVIETARSEDALALADGTQAVDLLLTDIVMPGVGGRALAAQFTARRPGTRVLFMSGYPAAAIGRHQMLERGLAFLQKPFSAAALAEKVREVLG